MGAFEHADIEFVFVVKVVVDRGEIHPCLPGDLAHGRGVKAVLSEDAAGCVQNEFAGLDGGGMGLLHGYLNTSLKQMFEMATAFFGSV
jgi:hypothetical protein